RGAVRPGLHRRPGVQSLLDAAGHAVHLLAVQRRSLGPAACGPAGRPARRGRSPHRLGWLGREPARVTLKLGLIGYGAIGKRVEEARIDNVELAAVLVKRARLDDRITNEPDRFFAVPLDVVAECAGHDAVRAHGQRVFERGADFLVTSVGAFTDDALLDRLLTAARANGRRLILPSAGIGALG